MKQITSVEEIEAVISAALIAASGLQVNQVVNANSSLGPYLSKDGSQLSSIRNDEQFIVFDVHSRESDDTISETYSEEQLTASYTAHIIVYGETGTVLASKVAGQFRTDKTKLDLRRSGLYVEAVSNPQLIHEIKNETVWSRNDFDIDVSVYLSFESASDAEFESIKIQSIRRT